MSSTAKPVSPEDSDLLAHRFIYNPETGEIRHRYKKNGGIATCKHASGHLKVGITFPSGRRFIYAHRLAWFLHYGVWPEHVIDHINGDPADNRISNLRDITQQENTMNRRTKPKAARFHPPTGKWQACIRIQGILHSFGYHDTKEEAERIAINGTKHKKYSPYSTHPQKFRRR